MPWSDYAQDASREPFVALCLNRGLANGGGGAGPKRAFGGRIYRRGVDRVAPRFRPYLGCPIRCSAAYRTRDATRNRNAEIAGPGSSPTDPERRTFRNRA